MELNHISLTAMRKRLWRGVRWLGACLYDHMHTVCVGLRACIFMWQHQPHVLSVHACWRAHYQITAVHSVGGSAIKAAAGRTVQVAVAVLSVCSRGSCSALRGNKSFIRFVVFLTKGSRSRNKVLLSIHSAPILSLLLSAPKPILPYTVMQVETRSHFHWRVAIFLQRQANRDFFFSTLSGCWFKSNKY